MNKNIFKGFSESGNGIGGTVIMYFPFAEMHPVFYAFYCGMDHFPYCVTGSPFF